MTQWHQTVAANLGLRSGGLALLAIGWTIVARLHHAPPVALARDAALGPMLFSAIAFLCGSGGSALLFVGPGLWEKVEVSERWRRTSARLPEASASLQTTGPEPLSSPRR